MTVVDSFGKDARSITRTLENIKDPEQIERAINTENVRTIARHHETHAASAFYMSPFEEALVVSYDGGGDDGHFNVYTANKKGIKLLEKVPSDFGGGYLLCGSMIREVAEKSRHQLALSGKMMGLCAYGNVIEEHVPAFAMFFFNRDYKQLAEKTGLPLRTWITLGTILWRTGCLRVKRDMILLLRHRERLRLLSSVSLTVMIMMCLWY